MSDDYDDHDAGPGSGGIYVIGYWICFAVLFLACWVYCIAEYGFLLGVGLGWLPSAITAGIISLLWPLVLIALMALAWLFFHG